MSILLAAQSRVLIHGMETPLARAQYPAMTLAGTKIVGAISQETSDGGLAAFASAAEAVRKTRKVDVSVIFNPPASALQAVLDAIDAGIKIIVCIADYVPVHDALRMKSESDAAGALLIGPSSTGVLTPRQARVGFFCDDLCIPGRVGVVAKSGSVAFAAMAEMKAAGIGVSTVVSVGGDLVKGSDYCAMLELFDDDPNTDSMLLLGEVGGDDEERAATYISGHIKKPVVAFVSGRLVKPGQAIGHAGAIVTHGRGGHAGKVNALRAAGVAVAEDFPDIVPALKGVRSKVT